MKLKWMNNSVAALCLLALVTSCSPSDSPQKEDSTKVTTVENKQSGGPDRRGPPGDEEKRTVCEALMQGPTRSTEHGPLDNADLNRDGTVLREELETFMDQGKYRRITIPTFFNLFDADKDGKLSAEEFAKVDPPNGFDGTDADGDCVVTQKEVVEYASQAGRSYRMIGLGDFFDLVDSNGDSIVTPKEIEAAHESGLLARF